MRLAFMAALLLAASASRAQTYELAPPVYLYQPGSVSATLLAAPTSLDTFWSANIIWDHPAPDVDYSSFGFFNIATASTGQTSGTSPLIPTDGGQPLLFAMEYIGPGDPDFQLVTTGSSPTQNAPWPQTAGVIFGANHTADIGFARAGTSIASFAEFPLRIRVSNVSALGMCQ